MTKAEQWLLGVGAGGARVGESDYKGEQGNFGGDRYVHYIDCGDGFIGIYICKNLSNCAL